MNKYRNEYGLSLAELLAVLAITSIISVIAYSVLFSGMQSYESIKNETVLRDEADLVMAELISTLYLTKEVDITKKYLPAQNSNNFFVRVKNVGDIGFIDNKVNMGSKQSAALKDNKVILGNKSRISENNGRFSIVLHLIYQGSKKDQELITTSEVSIIRSDGVDNQ